MIIVLDANVIISSLLGGAARFIILKPEYRFVTTEYTFQEVRKYLYLIENKLKVSREKVELALLVLPIKKFSADFYNDELNKAKEMINIIDPKDVEVLALAIKLDAYLWTEDKHFDSLTDEVKLLKTKDLI